MHLMRHDGFTCLEAENGEQAIALLERQPVMLVLSDLRMPKLDGLALLGRFAHAGPTRPSS
jgi:CheY-like chemotaxis protein